MRKQVVSLSVLAAGLFLNSGAALAELKAPRVGTVMRWTCEGPYTEKYVIGITENKDGLIRYEGVIDKDNYWIEKSKNYTGTSLWVRKFDDQFQWFDEEDFAGLADLVPGSRYKGAVPAQHGTSKWVWDYQVSVGEPRTIDHPVLGNVNLSTIIEQRKVYHGDYWSKMTSYVAPELGITVQWIYEDPKGVERCDLADLKGAISG